MESGNSRNLQRPDLLRDSFPEQRACVLDHSPFKVVFCTRRGAKSFSFGLEAVYDSYDHPGAKYLFLGLTREEARRIFWKDILKEINRKYEIGMVFNESRLEAEMPNGATIVLGAADANEQEFRKLLGQKYRKVCVDEAQDWCRIDLHDLVYEALKPACADLRGSISLRGTPGKFLKGFFRQITPISVQAGIRGERGSLPGWSTHCWDTSSNTGVLPSGERMSDRWRAEIEELHRLQPGIELTPSYRRHYQGEWVIEEDALVYRYTSARNDWGGVLPVFSRGSWHYVLGVDLGYEDASAFTVCAYHDHDQTLYIVESTSTPRLDITAVAERIKEIYSRYAVDVTVIDGANKQAVMEIRNRHDLPLTVADKIGKSDFIELMNAEFTLGHIRLNTVRCAQLIEEYAGLVWDDRGDRKEEHAACPNHAADSALYAWRRCYQYLSAPIVVPPEVGTPAWLRAQEEEMEKAAQDVLRERMSEELTEGVGDSSTWEWSAG